MKVCPKCEDEFRDDIVTCSLCQVALLHDFEMKEAPKKQTVHEFLAGERTLRLIEASLESCKEIERVLLENNVATMLEPVSQVQASNLGATSISRYAILVSERQVEEAAQVLNRRFAAQIEKEGFGVYSDSVVRLDEGDITCPACGFVGALLEGACPECELFLGEPT